MERRIPYGGLTILKYGHVPVAVFYMLYSGKKGGLEVAGSDRRHISELTNTMPTEDNGLRCLNEVVWAKSGGVTY